MAETENVKPPEPQQFMCTRDCYMKHETEKPMRYKQGQVANFVKAPAYHFMAVGKVNIDFGSSTLEVLKASEAWALKDMADYAKKEYRIILDTNLPRNQVIDKFIDARFRNVGTKPYVG